jgi:hypothetical protein
MRGRVPVVYDTLVLTADSDEPPVAADNLPSRSPPGALFHA